jgi:hypothetical protein
MLSTQTMYQQTSALAFGAPGSAHTRAFGGSVGAGFAWYPGGARGPEAKFASRPAGTAVAPFAAKKITNNRMRPLGLKKRRPG